MRKASGTEAAPVGVVNGDDMGGIIFQGYSGGTWQWGAFIDVAVDGVPAGPNIPTRISFGTNTGAGMTTHMEIIPSGDVGIGTTPSAKLHIAGTPGTDGIMFPDGTLQTTAAGGFTPSTYAGGESITFPNGLILKHGIVVWAGAPTTITFATPFPTAIVSASITSYKVNSPTTGGALWGAISRTRIQATTFGILPSHLHWQAWGH